MAKGCQRPAGNVGELKPKYSFCQCVCNYGTIYFILSKCVSFPSACFLGPCRGIVVVCVHNQSTEITSNKGPLETWVWGWLTFCEPRSGWFSLLTTAREPHSRFLRHVRDDMGQEWGWSQTAVSLGSAAGGRWLRLETVAGAGWASWSHLPSPKTRQPSSLLSAPAPYPDGWRRTQLSCLGLLRSCGVRWSKVNLTTSKTFHLFYMMGDLTMDWVRGWIFEILRLSVHFASLHNISMLERCYRFAIIQD